MGKQGGSWSRRGRRQGEVAQPQARLCLVFPSYLDGPLSRVTGEADPWHRTGSGEQRMGRGTPSPLAHSQSRVKVLPGAETEHPQKPESIPSDGVRRKGKNGAASAATMQATQGKGLRGQREEGRREKSRQETRCRGALKWPWLRTGRCLGSWAWRMLRRTGAQSRPAAREWDWRCHSGGGAGAGAEAAQRRQQQPGHSGVALRARQGEQQLLRFHRVTQMRGEAGQSPDSLSARRPPEGRGDLWALHIGPSAPAGFGRVHWALRFALILLKLCQCQLIAGTCPETI